MPKVRFPRRQCLILDNVSWQRYTRLLREFSDQHLRLTYDRGVLEIMAPSHEHEGLGEFLGLIVFILTQELKLHIKLGGSTTLRRKRKQKGLEPDKCYWIAHAPQMRGKTVIDLRSDPPPDLAIEVDITHSSIDRMRIYASLRVPEVWRYEDGVLNFYALDATNHYVAVPVSAAFALGITPGDIMPFIKMRNRMDEDEILQQFRVWIQGKRAGTSQP